MFSLLAPRRDRSVSKFAVPRFSSPLVFTPRWNVAMTPLAAGIYAQAADRAIWQVNEKIFGVVFPLHARPLASKEKLRRAESRGRNARAGGFLFVSDLFSRRSSLISSRRGCSDRLCVFQPSSTPPYFSPSPLPRSFLRGFRSAYYVALLYEHFTREPNFHAARYYYSRIIYAWK